ncbi:MULTISPECIES: alpha/beta fold hydrolase [unclassified Roseateles]|uniref:alpha/beta fold hydrolase n=1 Tax=unclassified Roseateles TaxID=2626991 RepID=UPI0006FC2CAB|nr:MULTISPECIES: alpha/beta hydrolase [unclassified Roseateles]KQW44580.1 alpha/beta hydrolase [Pelomonas sp. Root405]KRA69939.1 alpha/beta hydrolase [Pelomonas sp. Root662]
MTQPRLRFVNCLDATGLHRMAYWEWDGPRADAPVLVCVHGLSRQGRDFDALARVMGERYRVVCPDVVGRGRSDWLRQPSGYQIPGYVSDMVALLARLDVEQADWVGTSMGGLIGLGLAALPRPDGMPSPIRRLVLNDVGPAIRIEALQRIGSYLGKAPRFKSLEDGAAYLRGISEGFGPHTDEEWLALSAPLFREEAGEWKSHYDPAIALPFAAVTPELVAAGEAALWAAYDQLRCPTLLIRGAESDLLSAETARAMTQRGPNARLVELAGIGHAPTLIRDEQIAIVRDFLGP